jgi:hypothetical protein
LTASVRVDPSALDELATDQPAQQDYSSSIRDLIDKRKQQQ